MKKILGTLLGLITVAAIFLGCAENPDGSCNLVWTGSCLALAALCGWLWNRYFASVHITGEAYRELQRQIQNAIDLWDDEATHKTIEIDAELPDDAAIYLTIEMTSKSTQTRFRDDAWGAPKWFNETNWECNCEITKVEVLDSSGKARESDFDESRLDLEYEVTDWQ